jgi:hypothetical protein
MFYVPTVAHAEVRLHKEDALMARRKKVQRITYLDYEDHCCHWVPNLPDNQFWQTLERLRDKRPKNEDQVGDESPKEPELFRSVLIPIFIRNGSIPQNPEFKEMLKKMNLSTRNINEMLHHHHDAVLAKQTTA